MDLPGPIVFRSAALNQVNGCLDLVQTGPDTSRHREVISTERFQSRLSHTSPRSGFTPTRTIPYPAASPSAVAEGSVFCLDLGPDMSEPGLLAFEQSEKTDGPTKKIKKSKLKIPIGFSKIWVLNSF